MEYAIQVRNLTKKYKDFALEDIYGLSAPV